MSDSARVPVAIFGGVALVGVLFFVLVVSVIVIEEWQRCRKLRERCPGCIC